ncbi:MAG: sulfite exporter TauE/SafE family protein [Abditibacteriaceae bacterium]
MLTHILIECILALALAGFVQGSLGFGNGMVAMALLPLAISVKEASPVVVLFTLPSVSIILFAHWRHCQLRDGWLLILGTCIGTPLGVYLLTIASESILIRTLGALLLLFAVQELWGSWRGTTKLNLPIWSGLPIGTLSGALGGAFNCGGPPLLAYLFSRPWRKERIVAILQLIFIVGAALRMITMLQEGLFTPPVLHLAIWAAVPVLLAVLIGTRVLKLLPTQRLRTTVFTFVGLIALKFLILG